MTPVIFIGHGSPMNAIENNKYSKSWKAIGDSINKPEAILSISAHWETNGTKVSILESPKTIHDFYGFPQELFDVVYAAKGDKKNALRTIELIGNDANADESWGLDHGTWSVLRVMYPEADIPVYQLGIDMWTNADKHFKIGEKIKELRNQNVLIMGSGNIVHNLGLLDYSKDKGYDWAYEFNDFIVEKIGERDYDSIINYSELGRPARLSVPTTEHFNPLLYVLGATNENDKMQIFNKDYMAGSIAMTSFVFS